MNGFWITEGMSATSNLRTAGCQYGGFRIPTEYLLLKEEYWNKLRKIFCDETAKNGAIRALKLVKYVSEPIPQHLSCFTNTAEIIGG